MNKVSTLKKSLVMMMSALSIGLTGCGTLPTASLATANAFSTQSGDTASTLPSGQPPQGRDGHGGDRHGKGGLGIGLYGPALNQLSLTDDQKTQIAALAAEAKTFMEANKPTADASAKPDFAAQKAAFEAAFKSDTFDPGSLTANRPTPPVMSDTVLDFIVAQTAKVHDILTAEQRAQLASAAPADAPANRPSPPADAASRESQHLDDLATRLGLSDDQKTQLQAIFADEATTRQTEMETRRTQMEAERTRLNSLLSADSLDTAALKTLLQARASAPKADDAFATLVKIHDLLTADQRATWLTVAQHGPQMGGPGGHGGPAGPDAMESGGRGGKGGPGRPDGEFAPAV